MTSYDQRLDAVERLLDGFDLDACNRDPVGYLPHLVDRWTVAEIGEVVAFLFAALSDRKGRREGADRDLGRVCQAIADLIDQTPDAATLGDVARSLSSDDDLHLVWAEVAGQLLFDEQTRFTHEGRVWCEHEVEHVAARLV